MTGCFCPSSDSESCSKQLQDCLGISNLFGVGTEPQIEPRPRIDLPVLQLFKLYETPAKFYLIGRDEKRTFWRILTIDRLKKKELDITEDPIKYSKTDIAKWLINESEESGGFTDITVCYGIIGIVKFLEPYYMLLITQRRKVGEICGHTVYTIAESKMISIPNPSIQTRVATSDAELKYKNLLGKVDLSKNFYFSYTYHLMYSLQKNVSNTHRGKKHYTTMFVWNAFLTDEIRSILHNTIWTVALVYGFFQQTKCLVSGEEFVLTLIARRSRHYAGTRYLRRGVSVRGRVANEVETEQIVSRAVPEGQKIPIASVVQIRGSIPLFWSQDHSLTNPQPKIKLDKKKDPNYMTTQHHFENLRQRYGKRIIILNLLKTGEKKNRETFLRAEFAMAINLINRASDSENRLKPIHFDLSKEYRKGVNGAFTKLCKYARDALEKTDLFFCEAPLGVGAEGVIHDSFFNNLSSSQDEEENSPENEALKPDIHTHQNGVLRTNCIDCLDRTNFAQYAHGLEALAYQLRTLGISGPPVIDIDNPLAVKLMDTYVNMGNALALQYGGSEAHIKMFNDLRGNWNVVGKPRDYWTAASRHFNNTFPDKDKQNAINVFLGHFRLLSGRAAQWELAFDPLNIGRYNSSSDLQNIRPVIKRSVSGNILTNSTLNLVELASEDPQPSHEGATSGTTLDLENETETSSSISVPWDMHNEDLIREIGSGQMFVGSSSNANSDSYNPYSIPGYANSYDTKFTPAEEKNESLSSTSSLSEYLFMDVDDSIIPLAETNASTNASFNINIEGGGPDVFPGFSNVFSKWVFSLRTW